jgi:YbgC/YbaW family acyl-CoA thioester hydrolase
MKHSYNVIIKEFHLDTFGHVNNAVYLQLFEEARWEVITKNGYGLEQVMVHKKGPVILDVHLQFLQEINLREQVVIETQVEAFKGKVSVIEQCILNSQQKVACKARFTHAFFDLEKRRIIEPTEKWLRALGI